MIHLLQAALVADAPVLFCIRAESLTGCGHNVA